MGGGGKKRGKKKKEEEGKESPRVCAGVGSENKNYITIFLQ